MLSLLFSPLAAPIPSSMALAKDAIKGVDATLTPTRAAEVQIKGAVNPDCGNGSTFPDCRDPNHPRSTPTPGYPPNAGPCGNDSISIDCGEAMDAGAPTKSGSEHKEGWQNGCTEDDPCPAGGEAHGPKEGRNSP